MANCGIEVRSYLLVNGQSVDCHIETSSDSYTSVTVDNVTMACILAFDPDHNLLQYLQVSYYEGEHHKTVTLELPSLRISTQIEMPPTHTCKVCGTLHYADTSATYDQRRLLENANAPTPYTGYDSHEVCFDCANKWLVANDPS